MLREASARFATLAAEWLRVGYVQVCKHRQRARLGVAAYTSIMERP